MTQTKDSTTGERIDLQRVRDLVSGAEIALARDGFMDAGIGLIIKARETLDAILSRPSRMAASSEGEITEAMLKAGQEAADDKYWAWRGLGQRKAGEGLDGMTFIVRDAYRAMLAARPDAGRKAPLLDKSGLENHEVIDHPDAYLGAALDFSRSILAHCMASGLKARDLADGFQHLESAIRGLHARALRATSTPLVAGKVDPETLGDVSSLIAARCVALPGKLIDCPVCGAVDRERERLALVAVPVSEETRVKIIAAVIDRNKCEPWTVDRAEQMAREIITAALAVPDKGVRGGHSLSQDPGQQPSADAGPYPRSPGYVVWENATRFPRDLPQMRWMLDHYRTCVKTPDPDSANWYRGLIKTTEDAIAVLEGK